MRRILLALAALSLGGCVGGVRNAPPVVVYDFGLPAARLVADGRWSRLALEVRAPSWFDSLNIDYRLSFADPLIPREYADSRWAGTPGVLLAQLLRQQLGVVSVGGSSACLLRVDLQEFSQIFDSPQQSRGVLQASVRLIDAKRQPLAERQWLIDKPAASANAPGGVNALVTASREFGVKLADWLGGLDEPLKRCRSPQDLDP